MDHREAFLELLLILAFVDLKFDEREKSRLIQKIREMYGDDALDVLSSIQARMDEAEGENYIIERTKEAVAAIKAALPENEWKNVVKDLVKLSLAARDVDSRESAYLVNVSRMFDVELNEILNEVKEELCG